MNRAFKVIFNKSIGDYVVCGENTKSRKNKSSTVKVAVFLALVAPAVSSASTVCPNCISEITFENRSGNLSSDVIFSDAKKGELTNTSYAVALEVSRNSSVSTEQGKTSSLVNHHSGTELSPVHVNRIYGLYLNSQNAGDTSNVNINGNIDVFLRHVTAGSAAEGVRAHMASGSSANLVINGNINVDAKKSSSNVFYGMAPERMEAYVRGDISCRVEDSKASWGIRGIQIRYGSQLEVFGDVTTTIINSYTERAQGVVTSDNSSVVIHGGVNLLLLDVDGLNQVSSDNVTGLLTAGSTVYKDVDLTFVSTKPVSKERWQNIYGIQGQGNSIGGDVNVRLGGSVVNLQLNRNTSVYGVSDKASEYTGNVIGGSRNLYLGTYVGDTYYPFNAEAVPMTSTIAGFDNIIIGKNSHLVIDTTQEQTYKHDDGRRPVAADASLSGIRSLGGELAIPDGAQVIVVDGGSVKADKIVSTGAMTIEGTVIADKIFNGGNLIVSGKVDAGELTTQVTHADSVATDVSNTKFEAQSGTVNLVLKQGAQVEVGTLNNSKELAVTVDSLDAKVAIDSAQPASSASGAGKITVTGTGNATDQMTQTGIKEGLKKLATVVTVDNKAAVQEVVSQEGMLMGELKATVASDGELGEVTRVTITAQEKNTVQQAIEDVMTTQTLAFRSQINDVNKRMGDLRSDSGTAGGWARAFGGKQTYRTDNTSYKYNSLQIGSDYAFRTDSGKMYLGLTGTFTDGESRLINHGTSDDKTYGGGFYAGYLADSGWYVDFIGKRIKMSSDMTAYYKSGQQSKADLDTWGFSGSIETGVRVPVPRYDIFIEPQFELMYGRVQGFSYDTSAGVHVDQQAMESFVSRLGLSVGKTFKEQRGSCYVNLSLLNEFDGKSKATYSLDGLSVPDAQSVDIGGTWVEVAVGGTYRVGKNFALYGELATSHGAEVKNPLQWNIGGRLSF